MPNSPAINISVFGRSIVYKLSPIGNCEAVDLRYKWTGVQAPATCQRIPTHAGSCTM